MRGPQSGLRYERLGGSPPRVIVYGVTLAELFENAAEAVYAETYELSAIPPTYSRPIVAPGDTPVELLLNWLDELRYIGQRESIVWSWFVVDRLEEGGVQGSASGLPLAEVAGQREVATSVAITSDGIIEVPDGYWVELEIALGPPVLAM